MKSYNVNLFHFPLPLSKNMTENSSLNAPVRLSDVKENDSKKVMAEKRISHFIWRFTAQKFKCLAGSLIFWEISLSAITF